MNKTGKRSIPRNRPIGGAGGTDFTEKYLDRQRIPARPRLERIQGKKLKVWRGLEAERFGKERFQRARCLDGDEREATSGSTKSSFSRSLFYSLIIY